MQPTLEQVNQTLSMLLISNHLRLFSRLRISASISIGCQTVFEFYHHLTHGWSFCRWRFYTFHRNVHSFPNTFHVKLLFHSLIYQVFRITSSNACIYPFWQYVSSLDSPVLEAAQCLVPVEQLQKCRHHSYPLVGWWHSTCMHAWKNKTYSWYTNVRCKL